MMNPYGERVCSCKIGYAGPTCLLATDKCDNLNSCLNDGICLLSSSDPKGFVCLCPLDFYGDYCESNFLK